ncbi:VTT domain-containing protein [Pseudoalteromonas luteoviolacea]|uniref:TVP38/TMEM64 family protein n=1 Tax=Pseudoalteromonas luteoviolacea TaxID=43657 RepID=UPI001F31BA26|nr:VTT domain-containing protein [Pseudoalteromonas luteoviolacea]MCF6442473.1 VTT domain-containing protein [Pseudoalteromonas luteoviolacea]
MKSLLKMMLILFCFFASTFIVLKVSGVLSINDIKTWLNAAKELNVYLVALIVIGLLFLDLFIAVPTLTLILLAGFFLGPYVGGLSGIIGLMLAGTTGYAISNKFGNKLFDTLVKDPNERASAIALFQKRGPVVILLSRATPILPEISACMAGMTKMPFKEFIIYWMMSTIPYACIAAYAGSISTLENPKPAIYAAIGLTGFFWICWWMFNKQTRKVKAASPHS